MIVMSDNGSKLKENLNQEELQEEYLKSLEQLEEGQLIEGKVIEVNNENVFIDVGYKSEGKIPVEEFDTLPEVEETVSVVLVSKEGKEGQVVVSKRKADMRIFWRDLRKAFNEKIPVKGTFSKSIKGGFEVDLGFDVIGFNPLSKTDVNRVENPEDFVNVSSYFIIERLYKDNKIAIILSRRAWLEDEIAERKEDFFTNVKIGDEVEGTVKSFTSFGAFIDLGGFDGLLHLNDMSWGHATRPKDFVKKGDKIKLKVIKIDPEEKKINLSLKHFNPDPWTTFEDNFSAGDIIKGKVTKLTDFGAFIEIEEGIEGLAHISEFSWVKRIKHPKEILNPGDEVDAKILSYDLEKERVSLGLKQIYPNPWDSIEEHYPIGMHITRPILKITNTGAFMELEEGIDGFIHVDDLSWTKKYKSPAAVLKEGEETEAVVISIDPEEKKIRLGIKQLGDDPWQQLAGAFKKGSIIDGVVSSITDFGMFIKVQGDIEGLIHKSNISADQREDNDEALAKFKEGDAVKAVITELNPSKQKLSLSLKEYQKKLQKEELSKYIHDEEESNTVTLGDLLKNKENSED